jgi:hypothetical protein
MGADNINFSYSMKSLTVDKSNIKFVDIPENKTKSISSGDTTAHKRKMQYLAIDSLNTMLVSEPFTIQNGTTLNFCEGGGFITSSTNPDSSAAQQLIKNYRVDCRIELIEDGTNKLIKTVKQTQFSPKVENASNLTASKVSIGSNDVKRVRLKITFSSNIPGVQGMFVNEYNTVDKNMLAKLAVEELTLKEEGVITTYTLEQNYPNPFNPTTVINYQIPKDGLVTLKVYDVLGREIITLVNEDKKAGSYNYKFDASKLSSGVYFYKITANDFVQSKKMILLK